VVVREFILNKPACFVEPVQSDKGSREVALCNSYATHCNGLLVLAQRILDAALLPVRKSKRVVGHVVAGIEVRE
jgi:hypothetical protein